MKKIQIVCASDSNFSIPLYVMLKSLFYNTRSFVDIYILDGGITIEIIDKIRKMFSKSNFNINIIKINDDLLSDCLKVSERITRATYYRLLIPDILENLNKVIYLDCDLIVNYDIQFLWDLDIENKAIAAVTEMNKKALYVSSPWGLKLYKKLHIPEKNKYFNAGVLIMNLKKWRKYSYAAKMFNYLEENREFILWHDQDALNAILWNDWFELKPQWNVMSAFYGYRSWSDSPFSEMEYNQIKNKPYIIHYTNGKDKPWKKECNHPKKTLYYLYMEKEG